MSLLDVLNTPERREQARKDQEEMREKFGARLANHPAQANYLFGLARQQQALDQLAAVEDEVIDSAGENKRRIALFNQLAEGLALQGKFEDAVSICQSEPYRAVYEAKALAVKHIGIGCQCPPTIVKPSDRDAKGEVSQSKQKVEEVFDGTAVIAFFRCLLCGRVSANIG